LFGQPSILNAAERIRNRVTPTGARAESRLNATRAPSGSAHLAQLCDLRQEIPRAHCRCGDDRPASDLAVLEARGAVCEGTVPVLSTDCGLESDRPRARCSVADQRHRLRERYVPVSFRVEVRQSLIRTSLSGHKHQERRRFFAFSFQERNSPTLQLTS
jgi:hypothetical protein